MKEGNILFNNAIRTFYIGYMVIWIHLNIPSIDRKEENVLFNDTPNTFLFMVII